MLLLCEQKPDKKEGKMCDKSKMLKLITGKSSSLAQLVGQKTFRQRFDALCLGHVLPIFVRAKLRS